MPSAAAEWHFIGICQLGSDWPDTANPSRCSALTDECVTVSGRGSEGVRGRRGRPARGKRGLSGTTVRGIRGDLEDRMIRHPGIRWHRARVVSTVWDPGPPPPSNIYMLQMFVCSHTETSDSGYYNYTENSNTYIYPAGQITTTTLQESIRTEQ